MKKYRLLLVVAIVAGLSGGSATVAKTKKKENTAFQTGAQWKPSTDSRADIAIVYGVQGNPHDPNYVSFEDRVKSWRDHGYTAQFMTGIAWGGYVDYFCGKWDGKWHLDEGQKQMNGDTIWHGHMVPYIVPSMNYLKYMKEVHLKRVVDAGIDAIFLEEPEFWARGGYSEAFKREWRDYYGFDWRPQHESAENTYLSNKLKYHLYYRALNEAFAYAKQYGKSKGMNIRCYVPTHSLINYSQWQIVSPEASLASLPVVDGYIAQVWTNTSRAPNFFNGRMAERVFETAFLEYGCMESMTAPTGRRMYFLTDPVEDSVKDWADCKRNYEATFTAKLLYPNNNYYEVMPWPDRIYDGKYRVDANSTERVGIARTYSTQMQVMINTLNNMPTSSNRVSGSHGISVLMGNSLMFQRSPEPVEGYDDPQLSNFYGLALPLLKRGVPVGITHIENTGYKNTWKGVKVLLMSYSNMKPLDPAAHTHIANWVKKGGVLVYCATDADAYQKVQEWWNKDGNNYLAPSAHLFELMGMGQTPVAGKYAYGKGTVMVVRQDPKDFVMNAGGDKQLVADVKSLYENEAKAGKLQFKNSFQLTRGAFEIASVLTEGVTDSPLVMKGRFIDLFDPELPALAEKTVAPGTQAYLINLDNVKQPGKPQVVAAAARVYDEKRSGSTYEFVVKGPVKTLDVVRVLLPKRPAQVTVNGATAHFDWDELTKTARVKHENSPEGARIALKW